MDKVLDLGGNVAALLGIVVCLLAGLSRLAGNYHVLGFETVTLFIAGTAIMVFACLVKLHKLSQ